MPRNKFQDRQLIATFHRYIKLPGNLQDIRTYPAGIGGRSVQVEVKYEDKWYDSGIPMTPTEFNKAVILLNNITSSAFYNVQGHDKALEDG